MFHQEVAGIISESRYYSSMATEYELDNAYIDISRRWAAMSKAQRLQVGCIIVKDNQIISDGFNGTPSGFNNVCEDNRLGNLVTKPEVLHAESNALMKLARSTNSSDGATMYLTCAPCFDCSKLIIQSGIKRVVYQDSYRCMDGVSLLEKAGVMIEQFL